MTNNESSAPVKEMSRRSPHETTEGGELRYPPLGSHVREVEPHVERKYLCHIAASIPARRGPRRHV